MNRISVRIFSCLFVLGLAAGGLPAQAAEESFVIASAAPSGQRFIPLAPVRDGVVRVNNGLRSTPLRSDRVAMNNGFLRIDRAKLTPVRAVRPAVAENPVAILRGAPSTDDADITDLFDAAPETTSFRDALGGGKITHAWPLPQSASQKISSGYGMRDDPFHGRRTFHGGIDIAAATGTPILASAEGTVSKVATGKGLGKYVAVLHRDGTESYYGHLSAQSVRPGQRVMQGQKLGELGSTGRSTGPHLDYRLKKNGENVNPMTVLRAPTTRVASR